jgi:hypothetical protein
MCSYTVNLVAASEVAMSWMDVGATSKSPSGPATGGIEVMIAQKQGV